MGPDSYLDSTFHTRVLLICHEPIGTNMAGPAIRYWELARVLGRDYDVRLAHPGRGGPDSDGFETVAYDRGRYESLSEHLAWADTIVVYGLLLHNFPQLTLWKKPLAVDVYDVFLLENMDQHDHLPPCDQARIAAADVAVLNLALRGGDFYLCASERQRDFWLGMLAANGRLSPTSYGADRTLRTLVDVVPFGLRSTPPTKGGPALRGHHPGFAPTDKLFLWGGGLWDWFDPETLVKALAQVVQRRPEVKLYFMARQHLDADTVPSMRTPERTLALCREMGLLDRNVYFGDWVPYDRRQDYLLEADGGVSLHREGAEADFAFRTRLLDYVWAGLPIICTKGDVLADMVSAEGLGLVVAPGDVQGVANAMEAMLEEGMRERLAPNFRRVAERLTWEAASAPLERFIRTPHLIAARSNLHAVEEDGRPTPYHLLPLKAVRILREGGLRSLWYEAGRYLRWWRIYRR